MTVDCLPVRASVLPEMTFADLLQRVHETWLLACNYHVPWAFLRKALHETGVSCASPLLNFVPGVYGAKRGASEPRRAVEAVTHDSLTNQGLTIEGLTVAGPSETTSVDWKSHEVHVFDSGRVMQGKVKYMPAKYRRERLEAFIESFLRCLEAIAEDPGSRLRSARASSFRGTNVW
jgi:hypothetical protein